jgi:hypothetical protein
VTVLPAVIKPGLARHLDRGRAQHQRDLQSGAGWVELPTALARKYPNAGRDWIWPWVFPATRLYRDGVTGQLRRHAPRAPRRQHDPDLHPRPEPRPRRRPEPVDTLLGGRGIIPDTPTTTLRNKPAGWDRQGIARDHRSRRRSCRRRTAAEPESSWTSTRASRVMLGRDAAQVPICYTDWPIAGPNCSSPDDGECHA